MLSAIIITKNEEKMIKDCLTSISFAHEIIVVDTGNTDQTNLITKKHGARIIKSTGSDYSQFRNDGLKSALGDWILYVDADERVSSPLAQEIISIVKSNRLDSVYALPRTNIYLGKVMKHGGWGGDYVIRLFPKKLLHRWINPLHEQPEYSGNLIKLTQPLYHHSHRDLTSMTNKTILFTDYEAKLRIAANHPPINWWRFIRVMVTEFWLRFIKLSAWRDGTPGVIDGLFQVFNTFIIYARVWELQHESRRT